MITIHTKGAQKLANRLSKFIDSMDSKQRVVMERLAKIGINDAQMTYSTAQYDGDKDVRVSDIEWLSNNSLRFYTEGDTVAFIEFGTGVHYTEQHPKAGEYGAVRGAYGYKFGRFDSWKYKGNPGTNGEIVEEGKWKGYVKTHGNPPARAMYNAGKKMHEEVEQIIKEVYGK